MKAYCFVPEEKIDEIKECGLELALGQRYDCKVTTNDGMCIMGKLNPRDYSKDQFLPGKILVKVNLNKVRGFIGEGAYLGISEDYGENFKMFEDSLLPANEYKLGMYRNPQCLIVNTVLPDAVEMYDHLMDEIIPYENSGELYVECLYQETKDKTQNFREIALTACFDKLSEAGKIEKISYEECNVYKTKDTSYVIKKG